MNQIVPRSNISKEAVYIVYTPPRGSRFDILIQSKIEDLRQEALSEGLHPYTAPFTVGNVMKLDEALQNGYRVKHIVNHMHKRDLRSFSEIWFAGPGCSQFAREVMRWAFDHRVHMENKLDCSSPLRFQYRWFHLYLDMERQRKEMVNVKSLL